MTDTTTPAQVACPLVERTLIATLLDAEASRAVMPRLLSEVAARDFADASCGLIFEAAHDLHKRREAVDIHTVSLLLRQRGTIEQVRTVHSGVEAFGEMAVQAMSCYCLPAPSAAVSHARMIRRAAVLNRMATNLRDAMTDAASGAADPSVLLGDLQHYVQLEQASLTTAPIGMHAGMQALRSHYLARKANPAATVATGIACIDAATRHGGWYPGWLVLLAARPGIGKSSVAAQIAGNVGLDGPVLFIQAELAVWQTTERVSSAMLGAPVADLFDRHPERWNDAAATVDASQVRTLGDQAQTLEGIIGAAYRQHASEGLCLLIVDQLSKIKREGKTQHGMREHEWFGYCAERLRELAVELQIVVLLLHQINRTSKQDSRPSLHHLKGSGKLEEDADFVVLLHRDSEAEQHSRNGADGTGRAADALRPHECWVGVAKNRMGPTSETVLEFNVNTGQLLQPSRATAAAPDRSEPRYDPRDDLRDDVPF